MSEAWIRVLDAGELSAGMAIQMRPCAFCGRRETLILFSDPYKCDGWTDVDGSHRAGNVVGFFTSPRCRRSLINGIAITPGVQQGRIFRLAPDAPAVSETTSRELERVK